jgi:hypothetical protein
MPPTGLTHSSEDDGDDDSTNDGEEWQLATADFIRMNLPKQIVVTRSMGGCRNSSNKGADRGTWLAVVNAGVRGLY